MKNSVTCNNCSAENPPYNHICTKCKYYFRDKVSNIDIWETIGLIIESPAKAFQRIIFSENKNFIVFLTLFFSLRILILSRFVNSVLVSSTFTETSLILSYGVVLIGSVLTIIFGFVLIFILLKKMDYNIRLRDIYATYIYSNIPNLFALAILFPIELIIFGDYLFSNNPSPFLLKPIFAYILVGFEIGLIVWSIILNYISFKVLTGNIQASIIITTSVNILLAGLIIAFAKFIFSI